MGPLRPDPDFADPSRRTFLRRAGGLACASLAGCAARQDANIPPPATVPPSQQALLEDLERRTFNFFWETANPSNGLVPDRWPSASPCSIASVGFALTCYAIGVDRGYLLRAAARDRVLTTLRFFANAPQGPQANGVSGYNGFFYHFLDMQTGLRANQSELSTVDSALLVAGVLFCQSWFNDPVDAGEAEIRQLADTIYGAMNWPWFQVNVPLVNMAWTPESGFAQADWEGYVEAMILYIQALGSPTHPVGPAAWTAWCATYPLYWGTYMGQTYLSFAPTLGHQYSHLWIDFRNIQDSYTAGKGIDYFENSRRAALAQQAYAIANPMQWQGYDGLIWGITASDGPARTTQTYLGSSRSFRGYSARGAGIVSAFDDGTLAPTASLASLPFAPEIVLPTLEALAQRYGTLIYSQYGFVDAFNPSFNYPVPLSYGRLVPGFGWVDTDYIGIDQGAILGMIGNYRDGMVWNTMKTNPYIVRGLRQAGFTGGWLAATP